MAKGAKASAGPVRLTSEHMSVSVRKIDNGYIVSRSCDGPKGYSCTETFSAKKPTIEIPKVTTPGKKR